MADISQFHHELGMIQDLIRNIAMSAHEMKTADLEKFSILYDKLLAMMKPGRLKGGPTEFTAAWKSAGEMLKRFRGEASLTIEELMRFDALMKSLTRNMVATGRFGTISARERQTWLGQPQARGAGGRFAIAGSIEAQRYEAEQDMIASMNREIAQTRLRQVIRGLLTPDEALREQYNKQISIQKVGQQYDSLLAKEREELTLVKEVAYTEAERSRIPSRLWAYAYRGTELEEGPGKEAPKPPPTLTRTQQLEAQRATARAILEKPITAKDLIPGGEIAARNVAERIKALGFEIKDLNNTYIEGSTHSVRWSFLKQKEGEVTGRLSLVTDKYGTILQDMGTRFRGFWASVSRDITKVLQWGIAAGIIYGSMRKLNELIKESIIIQAKLADIEVALGSTTANLSAIFDNAARVAREFGTEVAGVIDGYLLAYRAAGQYTDEAQRTIIATQLLKDSMMLAKLAGIEQKQALDNLTAALRQMSMPLTEGSKLLDKWVAVTKVANVDLYTLSEGFAIVSGAAEGVGADVDRLSAVIAAFAEATQYSGTEVANAIRGFIAGFQTETSERQLARYGIAVRDVNGDLLDFTDVLDEIAKRYARGIISEKQLSDIANIMGGGWRRGAQLISLFKNWSRVADIYTASVNASGDAQDALALKMDTVQTALTNLKNAFSELARALGAEGGFLDIMQKGVLTLTKIVDGVTILTRTLGKAIPVILAFIAAWKIMGTGQFKQIALQLGLTGLVGQTGGAMWSMTSALGAIGKGGTKGQVGTPGVGIPLTGLGRVGGGLAAGVLSTLITGDLIRGVRGSKPDLIRSGITIGASIISTLIGANPLIGAIIGTAIGQIFVQEAKEGIGDMAPYFATMMGLPPPKAGETLPLKPEAISEMTAEERRDMARNIILSNITFGGTLLNLSERLARREFEKRAGLPKGAATEQQVEAQQTATMMQLLAGEIDWKEAAVVLGSNLALTLVDLGIEHPELQEAAKQLIIAAKLQQAAAEGTAGLFDIESPFYDLIERAREFGAPITGPIVAREKQERYREFSKGLITGKEWDTFNKNVQESIDNVYILYAALGDSAAAILGVDNATEAVSALTNMIMDLNEDQITQLITAVSEVSKAIEAVATAASPENLEALERARQYLYDLVQGTYQGQRYAQFEIPGIQYVTEGATQAQLQAAETEARRRTMATVGAITDDPALQRKMLDSYEAFVVLAGTSLRNVFERVLTDIDPKIWEDVLDEMELAFEDRKIQWDIQAVQPEEFAAIPTQQQIDAATAWMMRQFEGWKPEIADIGFIDVITHQTRIVHGDQLIVQMLMRDFIENQEKQLEGVFNLPADMAALVPMTGQLYFSTSPIAQAGGIGMGGWEDIFNDPANTLGQAGDDLIAAAANLTTAASILPGMAGIAPPATLPPSLGQATTYLTPEEIAASQEYKAGITQGQRERAWRRGHDLPELETPRMPYPSYGMGGGAGPITAPAGGGFMAMLDAMLAKMFRVGGGLGGPVTTPGGAGYTGMGGGGLYAPRPWIGKDFKDIMPQSIPITTRITLNNQNIVYVDGQKILDTLLRRIHTDLQTAKRTTGTFGYVVSA